LRNERRYFSCRLIGVIFYHGLCSGGVPMKEYFINIYKNNKKGLVWRDRYMAQAAANSLLLNLLNGGRPAYRIRVKLKMTGRAIEARTNVGLEDFNKNWRQNV